jgi:hypothetical protein
MTESSDPAVLARELAEARAECDRLRGELAEATQSSVRWRAAALAGWNERGQSSETSRMQREVEAMRATLSWRITRPLRVVRSLSPTRPG